MSVDNVNPLLQQMRDLHLPQEVSWWPPAPGWWVLAIALIYIVIRLYQYVQARRLKQQYRKHAILELQTVYQRWIESRDNPVYLQSANQILRRIMRHLEGGDDSLTLTGQQWEIALNAYHSGSLDTDTLLALNSGAYQPAPATDIDQVHRQLTHWINSHKSKRAVLAPTETPHA